MQTEQATYKLANVDGYALEQIQNELAKDGKFVIFQSCVSILFLSFVWPSKAYFIPSTTTARSIGAKYSILTMILGWWSLKGPIYTIQSLRLNMSGGLEVTADIREALSDEALQSGEVRFERMATIFEHVSRSNYKAIATALLPVVRNHSDVGSAYVGLLVNVPVGVIPYSVIGIDTNVAIDALSEESLAALHKPFRKSVPFEFITPENEAWRQLVEQGEQFYVKGLTSNLVN